MARYKSACIIFGHGCNRSEVETSLLFPYMECNGIKITDDFRDADLIVVQTCGVTCEYESRSLEYLKYISGHSMKDSTLVAIGCLAGINPDVIQNSLSCEIIPPSDIARFDDLINADIPLKKIDEFNVHGNYNKRMQQIITPYQRFISKFHYLNWKEAVFWLTYEALNKFKARYMRNNNVPLFHIRILNGCLDECNYCAIRFSSPAFESKPLTDIIDEFEKALDEDYKRFTFMGQDCGAYGQDNGSSIIELLEQILAIEGDYSIILTDLNMRWCILYQDALIQLFTDNAERFEKITIPIQSGSDAILKAMNRKYTAKEALDFITSLRNRSPEINIVSHILVGFPGETEEDFNATVDFIKEASLNFVSIYHYSDRPNTTASKMPNKVPDSTIDSRVRVLRKVMRGNYTISH